MKYCCGSAWCEEDVCRCEELDQYERSFIYRWKEFKYKVSLKKRKVILSIKKFLNI